MALRLRIFIVDDEWLQVESLKALVELDGHEVCGCAGTKREAVAAAPEAHPDILLCDVNLHGALEGIEAGRQIKEACGCGLIFVTGYTDADMVLRLRRAGADMIFGKPTDGAELLASIEALAWQRSHLPRHERRTTG
jgi:DNA-binding NarL/FixJ family response regulator